METLMASPRRGLAITLGNIWMRRRPVNFSPSGGAATAPIADEEVAQAARRLLATARRFPRVRATLPVVLAVVLAAGCATSSGMLDANNEDLPKRMTVSPDAKTHAYYHYSVAQLM